MKEIAELSLFYGCVVPWHSESDLVTLSPICDLLVTHLSDRRLAEWVRKVPAHYSPYLVAYLPLRSTGLRLPAFEEALIALTRAGYPKAIETRPYRNMELEYLGWKAGLGVRRPYWGSNFRATTLHKGRNPVYFSIDEVYSVTHTVFYLTDFAGPRVDFPAAERKKTIEVVEALVIEFWREQDWDVLSELLINLVGLNRSATPLFSAAFRTILKIWRIDGALPGRRFQSRLDISDRKRAFRRCYHTTLVGLLLCGSYLYRSTGAI